MYAHMVNVTVFFTIQSKFNSDRIGLSKANLSIVQKVIVHSSCLLASTLNEEQKSRIEKNLIKVLMVS